MKQTRQRIITAVMLLACFYLLMRQTGRSQFNAPADFALGDAQQMFQDLGGLASQKPVIVFVTSWCGVCQALEKDLIKAGVEYVRADIEQDREALFYYQKVTAGRTSGVPVTVVGTKLFLGYQFQAISRAVEALDTSVL